MKVIHYSVYTGTHRKVELVCPNEHRYLVRPHDFKDGCRCPMCPRSMSNGESSSYKYLIERKISPICEYTIKHIIELENRRYDFYFELDDMKYLIEIDGKQHFKFVPFFHENYDEFLYRQQVDRQKTFLPINEADYKVIRIDYTQENNIPFHIEQALKLDKSLYLSTPEMYQYLSVENEDETEIDNSNSEISNLNLSNIPQKPKLIFVKQ